MFGYSDVIPHLGIDELQNKEIMRMSLSRATSLIEVIRTLMDEWLAKATITGSARLLILIKIHVPLFKLIFSWSIKRSSKVLASDFISNIVWYSLNKFFSPKTVIHIRNVQYNLKTTCRCNILVYPCLNLFLVFNQHKESFQHYFSFWPMKHIEFWSMSITEINLFTHVMLLFLGDPEAAALLSDILRHVSKDSNPDDLSQMREILCKYINEWRFFFYSLAFLCKNMKCLI